jgi:tetratricopeptide (TPR) repeat protein
MFPYTKLNTKQLRKTNTATQSVKIYEPSKNRPVVRTGLLFLLLLSSVLIGVLFWMKPTYLQEIMAFFVATFDEIQPISVATSSPNPRTMEYDHFDQKYLKENLLTPASTINDLPVALPYLLIPSQLNDSKKPHRAIQNNNKETSLALIPDIDQQPDKLLDFLRKEVQPPRPEEIEHKNTQEEVILPKKNPPNQMQQPEKPQKTEPNNRQNSIPHPKNDNIFTLPIENEKNEKPEKIEQKKIITPAHTQQKRKINALLQQCERHFQANRLTTGAKGTAFDCYNRVLALDANNFAAQQGLEKIEARYQKWVAKALKEGNYAKARRYLDRIRIVNPDASAFQQIDNIFQPLIENALRVRQIQSATEHLDVLKQLNPQSPLLPLFKRRLEKTLNTLLQKCEEHLRANRLTTGKGGTAFDCYQQVLAQSPNNLLAQAGLAQIAVRYQGWAEKALQRGNLKKAKIYIDRLRMVAPKTDVLYTLEQRLTQLRQQPVSKPVVRPEKSRSSTPSSTKSNKPPTSPRPPVRSSTPVAKPPTVQKKSHSSKPQPVAPPQHSSSSSRPSPCNDILLQESLGIRPLTTEQKRFKQQYCH